MQQTYNCTRLRESHFLAHRVFEQRDATCASLEGIKIKQYGLGLDSMSQSLNYGTTKGVFIATQLNSTQLN